MSTRSLDEALRNPTKKELVLAEREGEKYSVPLMADSSRWPLHVKNHPLQDRAGILDRNGVPVRGKVGDQKFVAHVNDIHDPDGNPYYVMPLYADRHIAIDGHGHTGGPGFPYDSRWYGVHGWANLGTPQAGSKLKLGGLAQHIISLVHSKDANGNPLHPHGILGLVTLGAPEASAGNAKFIEHLGKHVLPQLNTSEKEGQFMDLIRSRDWSKLRGFDISSVKDPKDFFEKMSNRNLPTTARCDVMSNLVNLEDWGSDMVHDPAVHPVKARFNEAKAVHRNQNNQFLSSLDMPHALKTFNDYRHVPTGHGTTLIHIPRITRDFDGKEILNKVVGAGKPDGHWKSLGGHPDWDHIDRPGSDLYPAHVFGTALGDTMHSVPLIGHIIHALTGNHSYLNEAGAHYIVGGTKDNPSGPISPKSLIMMSAQTLRIPHHILAQYLKKALPVVINTSNEHLDIVKSMRYNDSSEESDMSKKRVPMTYAEVRAWLDKQTPEEQHRLFFKASMENHRRAGTHALSGEEMEQANIEAIDACNNPQVQAGIQQALRGAVKK